MSVINPYEETRHELAVTYPRVKTIFVDCDLDELLRRDTKGLYRRAMLPAGNPDKLNNLTGVNDTFEKPAKPDLHIHTGLESIKTCTSKICDFILKELGKYPGATVRSRIDNFELLAYGK
jgi:adenylylsulfate kinase